MISKNKACMDYSVLMVASEKLKRGAPVMVE